MKKPIGQHPHIDAPGLRWRPRADGWVAYWIAETSAIAKGFKPKTQRLWPRDALWAGPKSGPHPGEPAPDDIAFIISECDRLQAEMIAYSPEKITPAYDGSMRSVIECFTTDPDSRYQKLRYSSRKFYDSLLVGIKAYCGARMIAKLTGRDFLKWFEHWAVDEHGGRHVARAHARITMLRGLFSYGVVMELDNKHFPRLQVILSEMAFEQPKARSVEMTAEHVIAVRAKAHELGFPSVALAEAIKFDLMLRPKDVVGEWVPLDEPGNSEITWHRSKWLYGLHWREVSPTMQLTHRLSKSLRGRHAISDMRTGKVKTWNLAAYPMIVEEFKLVPISAPLLQRTGPMIIDEATGRPYSNGSFARRWRQIADAAGIPAEIQNRDSRAGAITEGIEATGGNIEAVRHAAGHSQIATTQRYSRAGDRQSAVVADFRAAKRNPNRSEE